MLQPRKYAKKATRSASSAREQQYSQSLERGLHMLRCFTVEQPVLGIAELAAQLHGARSTTHRYASTLVELGYLEQDASRRYQLAPRAADVGIAVVGAMPLHRHAQPLLQELRIATNYTVTLGMLDGHGVLHLDVLHGSRIGQYAVDLRLGVGTSAPLHCTAAGKALLAAFPEPQRKALIGELKLSKHGPNAIISNKSLREDLTYIRGEGLAVDNEESAPDVQAIATAVSGEDGEILGAIGLTAPRSICTVEELRSCYGASLLSAARSLTALLEFVDAATS